MKISDILNSIETNLGTWALSYKGSVHVAGDPFHLFSILAHTPGGVRIGILFKSETKRGEYEEAGMVDRTFWVVISRGRGFSLDPGDSKTKGTAGGAPMFDLCEQARDVVRGIDLPVDETETTFDFKGIEPYQVPSEYLVDAYQLEFSIGCQLPAAGTSEHDLVWDDGSFVGLGNSDQRGLE